MVKKYLVNTLLSLGAAQMLIAEEPSQDSCCCPSVIVSEPLDPCCIGAVYPYPANYAPRCGWDIYAKGEFLYLTSAINSHQNPAGNVDFDNSKTRWFFPKEPYRPGFRVAIGADLESVVFDLTYFRYHSDTTTHFNARPNGGVVLSVASPSLFAPINGQPKAFFQRVKTSLQIDLDYLIASLQRPVYMGKRIIMNLDYGIMGLWAGQKWRFDCTGFATPPPAGVTTNGVYKTNHRSWAVGPCLGFTAIALFPWHLQVIAALDLSVQYAEIYKVRTSAAFPTYPGALGQYQIKKRGTIAHTQFFHDGELGIGWGDYLGCDDRYYVNFSVAYHWISQHIEDNGLFGTATGWDDVNLSNFGAHGIAIGGRVDF